MPPSSPSRLCPCSLGLASFKALVRPSDGPTKHSHPRMEKHSTGARGWCHSQAAGCSVWYEQADRAEPLNPSRCQPSAVREGRKKFNRLPSPSGSSTPGKQAATGWLGHVSIGGGGRSTVWKHLVTIWPLLTTQNWTLRSPPYCPAPNPLYQKIPKGSCGSWETEQLTPGLCLCPPTTWLISPHSPNLENGDKIILGHKGQSHRGSRRIWVTEMTSLEACGLSQRSSSPTFVEPIQE